MRPLPIWILILESYRASGTWRVVAVSSEGSEDVPMSDIPYPDTPQPDIPAPSPGPDIPDPPQPDIPAPDPELGLRPPEPSEPPGDNVPKVG